MALNYIQKELFKWYEINKRDLPWRGISDPYKIWLSEIILQQTRVNQGLSYYYKFTETYPTVKSLALADENDILKLWQGLGYYSRARNLHYSAKQIHDAGNFPRSYKELMKLKGIGDYTASAISSFAYNEHQAVLDGNVFRVLSRLFGISTPIDTLTGRKEFKSLANSLLPKAHAGNWNQAIMEFGALQCAPKSPDCHSCPLKNVCLAFKEKRIDVLPFKKGKTKQQTRFLYFFFLKSKNRTLLIKRPKKGVWGGLYEFPNLEHLKETSTEEAITEFKNDYSLISKKINITSIKESIKHVLSHRILFCTFIEIEVDQLPEITHSTILPISKLEDFPVSRLMEKYISES